MSTTSEHKILQYLDEAHATETALVRVLESQIAITPRGGYRDAVESHLKETRSHAERLEKRRAQLGHRGDPFSVAFGLFETMVGQAVAISKTPFDLLRGTGGEEKVLKNAKDACASEALEIATYTAIERLARSLGDGETANLAASIRADEERMLQRVLRELPKLAEAVARADVRGDGSYDIATTGAGEAVRGTAEAASKTTRKAASRTKRQARQVAGAARAEGTARGAVAAEEDLPIPRYDDLTAEEIAGRLRELSQLDLAKVATYERRHEARATILGRIDSLQGDEPWPGYDELTVEEIRAALADADEERARRAREYERAHKERSGVLEAAEREVANA
jgi:ferritin-like metal-binding protein YciE